MSHMPNAWDPNLYQSAYSFVWERSADLLELLDPQPGDRILDVGCGTGQLTAKIAELGAEVIGIDSSVEMIEAARANYPAIRFDAADIRTYRTDEPFDAVFSNAVLHWVQPPERAAESISVALKPGGRFVAEFGGRHNVSAIIAAVQSAFRNPQSAIGNPWYFPSVGEYASLLESVGMEVTHAFHFPRFTPLEGGEDGLRNWLAMFGGAFTESIAKEDLESALPAIESQASHALYKEGQWHADYVRLRIRAKKV